MSISDINWMNKMGKTAFCYLLISLFCILFGAIYEIYSHGVYSYFMLYAFVFPLVGGTLLFLTMAFFKAPTPSRVALNLYHSGIAALTTGCLFEGVLEIYGTTNRLVSVYWALGILFLMMAIFIYSLFQVKNKDSKMECDELDL